MDELCKKISSSMKTPFASRELSDFIKELAFLGFDDIITTNYGYEFECALCGKGNLSENEVKKLQKHTDAIDKCNEKYALHTYTSDCRPIRNGLHDICFNYSIVIAFFQ